MLASCSGAFGDLSVGSTERAALIAPTHLMGSYDDSRPETMRARGAANPRPRDFYRGGECGVGDEVAEERERAERMFFQSSQWLPVQVTSRCVRMRSATVEAREIDHDGAWVTARPAIERCMHVHADRWSITVALEIDEAKGRVIASMVKDAKDDGLQACVASALADLCFEPTEPAVYDSNGPKSAKRLISFNRSGFGPGDPIAQSRREQLQASQQLAAVSSKCPAPQGPPGPDAPSPSEVSAALEEATPFIQQCMIRAGRPMEDLELALNVHGPTGAVTGAAGVLAPKDASLDACVADVLSWLCFLPFEAPAGAAPYMGIRRSVPRAQQPPPYQFAQVEASCPWRLTPSDRVAPNMFDKEKAVADRIPAVKACLKQQWGRADIRVEINVDIDPDSGGVIAASVHRESGDRMPKLDACVATALRDVCFVPFKPRHGEDPFRTELVIDPHNPRQRRAPPR